MENSVYNSIQIIDGKKYISLEEHQRIIQGLSSFWDNLQKVSGMLGQMKSDLGELR